MPASKLTQEQILERINTIVYNQLVQDEYTRQIQELAAKRHEYTRRVNIDKNTIIRHYRMTGEPIPDNIKAVLDKRALCKGRRKIPADELLKSPAWRPPHKASKLSAQSATATTSTLEQLKIDPHDAV